jgi:hypothetical protein
MIYAKEKKKKRKRGYVCIVMRDDEGRANQKLENPLYI